MLNLIKKSVKTAMVRHTLAVLSLLLCISLTGCSLTWKFNDNNSSKNTEQNDSKDISTTVTDSLGNTAVLTKNSRIVSLYGSYAECWQLSGGSLTGVTQDAIEERHLSLSSDVSVVGTVKEPNLEQIVALNPDYVIMSADLSAHLALENSLKQLHIQYGYFTVDTFDEYDNMMKQFCAVNNRNDLYKENVTNVAEQIDDIRKTVITTVNTTNKPDVLIIRAYTTGIKAKGDDNLAGVIIKEFGCNNIVDNHPSMLEDLSVEEIINIDPDYIFVLTMGDESKALAYLDKNVISNPAWSNLTAIKENHYYILPKELFHYKPNNKWGESYKYIADILK